MKRSILPRKVLLILLLPLLLLFAGACTDLQPGEATATQPAPTVTDTPAATNTPAPPDPTEEPTVEPTAAAEYEFMPAPVETVAVLVPDAETEEVEVTVSGNLPDGCSEIDETAVERTGDDTFNVTITMRRQLGVGCTLALVPYETSVSLDVTPAELEQGEYTVTVNEQMRESFTINGTDAEAGTAALVTFELDETIAAGSEMRFVSGTADAAEQPPWAISPGHTEVTFTGYVLTDTLHTPRIYVYPIEEFRAMNETAATQIDMLETLLADRPDTAPEEVLPFLPLFNAAQVFHTRLEYLDFQNGSGVRYLTQYDQAVLPITNYDLLYTFQGLTADGQHYVAAVFPISHPDLPASIEDAPEGFDTDFAGYLETVRTQLEDAAATSFIPAVDALDALIASLEVQAAPVPVSMLEQATTLLSEQLGIPAADIVVETVEQLPDSDTVRVVLRVQEQTFEFHISDGQIMLVSDPLPPATGLTINDLLEMLASAGLGADQVRTIPEPLFDTEGRLLSLADLAEVQVYIFPDAATAEQAAGRVSPDGTEIQAPAGSDAGPALYSWVATPHFYRLQNVIVLYVGDDPNVLTLLDTIFGPQFAGG